MATENKMRGKRGGSCKKPYNMGAPVDRPKKSRTSMPKAIIGDAKLPVRKEGTKRKPSMELRD